MPGTDAILAFASKHPDARRKTLCQILTSKESKTKSKLGKIVLVSVADTPKVARMLPYA